MQQETIVKNNIRDLKGKYNLDTEFEKDIAIHLNYCYVAGVEDGLQNKSSCKPVAKLDKWGNELETYKSASQAGRVNHIDVSFICRVCNGGTHSAHGMYFKYITDENKKNNG